MTNMRLRAALTAARLTVEDVNPTLDPGGAGVYTVGMRTAAQWCVR